MGGESNKALADRVSATVSPVVAQMAAEVESVAVTRNGRSRLVRIIVDADDGVTLDFAAELNRAAAQALESAGIMGEQPYVVEVSSPGVTRPLTHPRQWRRNADRLVRVVFRDQDRKPVTGRIAAVEDTNTTILVGGSRVRVDFADVKRAVIQVEFDKRQGV